jgi:DNA replication protein DnaC
VSDLEKIGSILPRALADIGTDQPPEEPWTCPQCGIIQPLQLPTGRYIRRSCACERAARRQILLREQRIAWMSQQVFDTYGWLGERFSDMPLQAKTFDTFQAHRQQEAYDKAREFALTIEGSLVLHGSYGTGKTHLLAAICNELRTAERASRFTTAPKLFKAMQSAMEHHEDTYLIMRKAIMTPLLVLDDVDKAKPSEFREETYYEIIDERTKHGRPIAISTNKLTELSHYIGGAACSRLSIGQIAVEMTGDDFRMEM